MCDERVGNDGGAMAETIHSPALQEVEITFAIIIRQPHAAAFSKDDFRAWRDVHQRINVVLTEFHFKTPRVIPEVDKKIAKNAKLKRN